MYLVFLSGGSISTDLIYKHLMLTFTDIYIYTHHHLDKLRDLVYSIDIIARLCARYCHKKYM